MTQSETEQAIDEHAKQLDQLEELTEFKRIVMPHLVSYIKLMQLVGNYTRVISLENYVSQYYSDMLKQ